MRARFRTRERARARVRVVYVLRVYMYRVYNREANDYTTHVRARACEEIRYSAFFCNARAGVRLQNVANGEKLHVLSGERRERG